MSVRKAQNVSYQKFLTKDSDICSNRLEIANFQRNYVWSPRHVKSLIKSINKNEERFYLGNIVVQRNSKGGGNRDFVVDGQQRLVTLSLVVCYLKNKVEGKRLKGACNNILVDNNGCRIKFSRPSLNKMYSSIIKGKPLKKFDENQGKLLKSFKTIKKELESVEDLEVFLKKILNLEFVVIKCPHTHDVFQLFESLNRHGEKLSPVELTKNALLATVGEKPIMIGKLNNKWEKIQAMFEKEDNKVAWFDIFLRQQWYSIGGKTSDKELFDKIKEQIENNGAEKYTDELLKDSGMYLALRNAGMVKKDFSENMSENAWKKSEYLIKMIKILNLDQVYAVLLALVKYGGEHAEYFSRDHFFKDIEKIWSFLVLNKYSGKLPNITETIFANFCFDIHNDKRRSFDKIKKDFFLKLKEKVPNKKTFSEMINNTLRYTGDRAAKNKVDFKNHSELIKTILLMYLSEGNEIIDTNLTIEHIIPKSSLENWKNISQQYIEEIKNLYRYKLGNLTLLKNDNVKNKDFVYKYEHAYKKSQFKPNQQLNDYSTSFNSRNPINAVKKRGEAVAGEIFNICISKLT